MLTIGDPVRRASFSLSDQLQKNIRNARASSVVLPEQLQNRRGACSRTRSHSIVHTTNGADSILTYDQKLADILTFDQKLAFREVFDLFDSNGGGSIDAEELDEALRSADIHLTKEEITEVLSSMDKDGNGEIDFEEFLQLMTNTERFLESVMGRSVAESHQREILLFEALTQFMKKSALHSINEIVGYYHNKYKKVQAPHVIRHYAAGARLIGLSEQQIRRHLDQLRKSSFDNKSPYAHPPYAFTSQVKVGKKDQLRQKLERITEESTNPKVLNSRKISEEINLLVPKLVHPTNACRGKIRLKILWDGKDFSSGKQTNQNGQKPGPHHMTPTQNATKKRFKYNGWVAQRFSPSAVREHLPVLTNDFIKDQIREEKKMDEISRRSELDFDDMREIRKRVHDLAKVYYKRIQSEKYVKATEHLKQLVVEEIPSARMRSTFYRAFDAYTDYRSTPVSSLCSRSLA